MKYYPQIISLGAILPLAFALLVRDCSSKTSVNKATEQSASKTSPEPDTATVAKGVWGGDHIRLEVTDNGGEVEYDCAHGTISERLKLDSQGGFRVRGTHVAQHGGPVREGEAQHGRAVEYSGSVKGKKMMLTVRFTDPSASFGSFTLTEGNEGELTKCY